VLDDASLYRRHAAEISVDRGAEWVTFVPGQWTAATPRLQALAAATAPDEFALTAYANEGRWVVMCPDCGGAQLAAREDARFMCVECANFAIEGLWRAVVWPADVDGIEAELERRPFRRNQNWHPGETVEDLAAEFAAMTAPPEPAEVSA
jgi:hypothetical protein